MVRLGRWRRAGLPLVVVALSVACGGVLGGGPLRTPDGTPVTIATPAGSIRGTSVGTLRIFLGVPYAAPPVGPLRFRPPQPVPRFVRPFVATSPGPVCPQLAHGSVRPVADDARVLGDEDCLHLNVWAHGSDRRRPVMVFIHGGGFQQGSGTKSMYDGAKLARAADVVVVTLNYRLGALGMVAHEALAAEDPQGGAGNYGIRDQIAALEWVRDNAVSFGGDPTNVTIFGESAGAVSVCALVGSPLASGLFRRAIAESGGGCAEWPALREGSRVLQAGFARGRELAQAAGCGADDDVPACLRRLDAATLVRAGTHGEHSPLGMPVYGPVVDGVVLTGSTFDRLRDGSVDVPLMVGSNGDEASIFGFLHRVRDEVEYERRVRALLGPGAEEALRIYPPHSLGTPRETYLRALGEIVFVCPADSLARIAARGPHPSFEYHFDHAAPGLVGHLLGAFHGLELAYLFANWPARYQPATEDLQVSRILQRAWAGFAHRGVPVSRPAWPAFRDRAPAIFRVAAPPRIVADVTDGRCDRLRAAGLVPRTSETDTPRGTGN